MNDWQIVYTERAEQDLRSIFEYIAFVLLEPEIALKQSRRIIKDVESLKQFPLRCKMYDKEPWKSQGLRVMQTNNYFSFYLPDETVHTISIIRIIYGKRNFEKQLDS